MSQRIRIRHVAERSQKLEAAHHLPTRLIVHTTEGSHVFPWKDIRYCVAMSNYCAIHLSDGRKIVVSKTLGALAAILPGREFLRVHQSHLVSIASIRCVMHHEVELAGDIRVPVSRNRRKELLNRISEISLTL